MFGNFFSIILLFIGAMICSFILTHITIFVMTKCGIVDRPSDRRVHNSIVPRGGGVVFVLIYTILLPLYEIYTANRIVYSSEILEIFLPIAIISFCDDVFGVNIGIRLLIHFFASILAIMWFIHPYNILHENLSMFLDLVIGTFALVTFLNIYNFMDGIDGITATETIHLSITIILLSLIKIEEIHSVSFVLSSSFIILGWSIGFLYFNWHPAKIFVGDVGSISLGFILGICLLIVGSSSKHLFLACIIASLYYIGDGFITILIRILKREKIWEPHLKHFFHQAVRHGMSHDKIVLKIAQCNIMLTLFALGSLYYPVVSTILSVIVVIDTLTGFAMNRRRKIAL